MRYYFILIILFIFGCKTIQYVPPDEQNVKISLAYTCREIDTFHNKFIFAFVPDTTAVDLWFTKQEQEIILNKADSINFFSFPDSLPKADSGLVYHPNCYPASLRIMTESNDKTVVFFRETTNDYKSQLDELQDLANNILEMAFNKKEYKDYGKSKPDFYFNYFDDL